MTPEPGRRRLGANARASLSGPKKFTSRTSRSAASVTSLSTGRWQVMPALQTSRSMSPCARAAATIWARSVTSSRTGTMRAGSGNRGSDAVSRAATATVVACRLSAAPTRAAPTPRLAPVIRTLRPVRSIACPFSLRLTRPVAAAGPSGTAEGSSPRVRLFHTGRTTSVCLVQWRHPLGLRGHLPGQRGDRCHLVADDRVNVRPGLQAVPVDEHFDGELVRLVERAGRIRPATDVVGLVALHRLAQLGAGRGAAGHVEVEHRHPVRHTVGDYLPGQQPGEVPGGGPVDGAEHPPLADLRGDRRGDTRDALGVRLERGANCSAHPMAP